MKTQRHTRDDLPLPLQEFVDYLKTSDTHALSGDIDARLLVARQQAIGQLLKQEKRMPSKANALALALFHHPRQVLAVLTLCLSVGISIFVLSNRSVDDAMLLGDDLPVEAFVDNGFEPWHYSENI